MYDRTAKQAQQTPQYYENINESAGLQETVCFYPLHVNPSIENVYSPPNNYFPSNPSYTNSGLTSVNSGLLFTTNNSILTIGRDDDQANMAHETDVAFQSANDNLRHLERRYSRCRNKGDIWLLWYWLPKTGYSKLCTHSSPT